MKDQRFLLGFVIGAATLLGVGVALAVICNIPVAASESPPHSTPVLTDAHGASSEPIPPGVSADRLNPPDQLYLVSNAVEEDEPKPSLVSQMDNTSDAPDYWFSSAPVPEGVAPEDLSPPDLPPSLATPGEAATPLQTYNAYLRISGAALKPRESNVDWRGAGGGGCIYASDGNTFAVFNAPVYLPQGSTVKYVRMYYNDTNAESNSQAWFTVYDLYGQIVLERSASSSGSSGTSYATSSEFTHTVDYEGYSYVVNWRPNELGSDMQVCGFRIYYHTPTGPVYLPLVARNAP
jgi:hypothetical protein